MSALEAAAITAPIAFGLGLLVGVYYMAHVAEGTIKRIESDFVALVRGLVDERKE